MTSLLDDLGEVFVALSDPNRRTVLERIAQLGEGTATTLAADLPISRQAVVKHLTQLDRARLVQSRRHGREVRYSLYPGRLTATAQGIEAVAARWEGTLQALKRIAEGPAPLDDAGSRQE